MAKDLAEILRKVERIQILASRLVDALFVGQYKSVFRGQGMEFETVREYQPGDDVLRIDWNTTARSNVPFVKQFREEREMTVLFLVDVSASGAFGSVHRSKLDTAIEVAALLMFSALKNNDMVGLITFGETVHHYSPPRKGKGNVLRLIRQLVALEPVAGGTRLEAPLEYMSRVLKRRAVAFLISDFIAPPLRHENVSARREEAAVLTVPFGWSARRAMAICHKRHDLTAVSLTDPREREVPDVGFLPLVDAETGEVVELDTGSPRLRRLFALRAADRAKQRNEQLRKIGVDELVIRTDENYLRSIRRFFRMRERRFR